jgi:hypothetical protein
MQIENLTIGSKVFIVHNTYGKKTNKNGAYVNQARVVCFTNRAGKVVPEFRMIGQNGPNLSVAHYNVFDNIKDAIAAITNEK